MRFLFLLILTAISTCTLAKGELTPNIRIKSEALGYALQYRVYIPDKQFWNDEMPVLFVTDGPGYIHRGQMNSVADRLIKTSKMEPAVIVFVDARNPDKLRENRRNSQFFCNSDYLAFYKNELIPSLESSYPIAKNRKARSILGVSFGGLNAACFGLMGADTFSGIAMHSPANHPVQELLPSYEKTERLPLKIFLSTGVPDDNTAATRAFKDVLESKAYPLKYIETNEGHDWRNWAPLVDDVLRYFYGMES